MDSILLLWDSELHIHCVKNVENVYSVLDLVIQGHSLLDYVVSVMMSGDSFKYGTAVMKIIHPKSRFILVAKQDDNFSVRNFDIMTDALNNINYGEYFYDIKTHNLITK